MKFLLNTCAAMILLTVNPGCITSNTPGRAGEVKDRQEFAQSDCDASVQIIGAKELVPVRFPVFASNGSYLDALIQLKTRLDETGIEWEVKLLLRDTDPCGGDGMLTNVVFAAASTINDFKKLVRPLEEAHLAKSPVYVEDIGATELVRLLCETGGMSATIHGAARCIQFGPNEFIQRPPELQWRRYRFDCTDCTFDFKGFPQTLPFAMSGFAFDQNEKTFVFIGPPAEAELLKSLMSAAGCKLAAVWPPVGDLPEF